MFNVGSEIYVSPEFGLFDRFRTDTELENLPPRQAIGLYVKLLLHDLEILLNTRIGWEAETPLPDELGRTVVAFGLPDMGAIGLRNPLDRMTVRERIQAAILAFEPRLADVAVMDITADDVPDRLSFRIQANLRIETATVPLVLETQVTALTRWVQIKDIRRGATQ